LGKMLLSQQNYELAADKLAQAFEHDEQHHNQKGITIITPPLCRALGRLHRLDKANQYIQRALQIAPNEKRLIQLREKPQAEVIQGVVKFNYKPGQDYGFIASDEVDQDIFFHRDHIAPDVFTLLQPNLAVSVQVKSVPQGLAAESISVLEPVQVVETVLGVIKANYQTGQNYGFITSNEIAQDIFFHRNSIRSEVFTLLKPGLVVNVKVNMTERGLVAENIEVIQPKLFVRRGIVKLIYTKEHGNFHGYITSNEETQDILFHEKDIGLRIFEVLQRGMAVEVEVIDSSSRLYANRIKPLI
jgi:cold shock CspA family protein